MIFHLCPQNFLDDSKRGTKLRRKKKTRRRQKSRMRRKKSRERKKRRRRHKKGKIYLLEPFLKNHWIVYYSIMGDGAKWYRK